jgi:hypothetical protein
MTKIQPDSVYVLKLMRILTALSTDWSRRLRGEDLSEIQHSTAGCTLAAQTSSAPVITRHPKIHLVETEISKLKAIHHSQHYTPQSIKPLLSQNLMRV